MAAGGGELVIDFEYPEPDPPPFTTIAWDWHICPSGSSGCATPPTSAARASTSRPLTIPPVPQRRCVSSTATMVELVAHIHREAIHHLAEVLLLRDLYRSRPGRPCDGFSVVAVRCRTQRSWPR